MGSLLALKIAHAESLISNALLEFGIENLALSFNGGKDCTVLLDLVARVRSRFAKTESIPMSTIYVTEEEPFPEVTEFIKICEKRRLSRYPFIKLLSYPPGLRKAFSDYIDASEAKSICILVGVRRTDPYCKHLKEVHYTDNGWPKFLRIHPLLDWSYADIWAYIDYFSVPYCDLYNRGFTSIGSISKTKPNPRLLANDGSYGHARKLVDDSHERDGRQ